MINQISTDPIMKKAVRIIYDMSDDTTIRESARLREKALHDEASVRAEGIKEGIGIGEANALSKVAEKMRLSGFSDEEIKRIINIRS